MVIIDKIVFSRFEIFAFKKAIGKMAAAASAAVATSDIVMGPFTFDGNPVATSFWASSPKQLEILLGCAIEAATCSRADLEIGRAHV